jgi:PhnB protein
MSPRRKKVKPIPDDCHSITPYLLVPNVARLIKFLEKAFDGVDRIRITRPNGTVLHAQVRIGDSLVMIGEPRAPWKPRRAMLYLYVSDVDSIYWRAIKAGAKSAVKPTNMFYGDRHACVTDVAGNNWWIATRIENVSGDEIQKRATAFFKQMVKPAA